MSPTEMNPQPDAPSEPIAKQPPVAEMPTEKTQPTIIDVRVAPGKEVTPVAESAPVEDTASVEEPAVAEELAPAKQPSTHAKKKQRGGRNRKKLPLVIAGAVAGVAAIVVLIFVIGNALNGDIDIFKANAFFISTEDNGETKYALYKKNGEKITDFVYSQVGTFVNGYAYVRNLDGKEGIINDSGKMTVEFDEYDDITPRIGFYEAYKGEKESLILGDGSRVVEEYESYEYSTSAPYVAVRTSGDQYGLYNALGNKLADFESSELPYFSDADPKSVSAIGYKGGLIILSNKKLKPVETIKDPEAVYDIAKATEDGKIITFYEHGKRYDDDAKYAIYNKKFTELGDKCDDLNLYDDYTDKERIYVTCENDGKAKLIRKNEVTDLVVSTYDDGYVVYDEDHYAYYDQKDKRVDIYANGDKKKSFNSDSRIVASIKGYTVNDYNNKTATLYSIDGEEIYKLSDTNPSSELAGIDKNNNIIVRDSKRDTDERYAIIDKDGKELSGRYGSIVQRGDYYAAYHRNDDTADLLDKDGKVIVSGNYEEFLFNEEDDVILGQKGDYSNRSYDLIDAKGKKVIVSIEGSASYYEAGYIRAMSGNKVSYYTREGKLIYEYEGK